MNANLTAPAVTAEVAIVELTDGKSPCNCSEGCPGLTTRFFSQGHDARLVTRLRNAVTAGEMTTAEAFAEVLRRGGTERLQIKLDAAVANARAPKKSKKAKKAAPLVTFEIDGFTLREDAHATEVGVWATVGRWAYQGDVTWHQMAEEDSTDADTMGVFRYEAKSGESRKTTRFTRAQAPAVAEVADEAPEAEEELPVNTFANRVATPAVPEVAAPENTDDIPF